MTIFFFRSSNNNSTLIDLICSWIFFFSATTVKCQNLRELLHELSNEGAREQFEKFLEGQILPEMVECASLGDRGG